MLGNDVMDEHCVETIPLIPVESPAPVIVPPVEPVVVAFDGSSQARVAVWRKRTALALLPVLAAASTVMVGREGIRVLDRMRRRRARRAGMLGAIIGLAGVAFARWQLQRVFTEQPEYVVEQKLGAIEIRSYPPTLIAETRVFHTDWDEARQRGFRRLFRYISGENHAHAPIEMTTPVVAHRNAADDAHVVGFIMKDAVPEPNDPEVSLRPLGPRRIAAHRFNGSYDVAHIRELQKRVVHELVAAGFTPIGEPQFAGYDPPSTLPALRRVEIWVEIA